MASKGRQQSAGGFVQKTIQELGQSRSQSPRKRRRQSGESPQALDLVKEFIEGQKEEFQKLRDDFKEIADVMKSELSSLKERIRDLEDHVNRKDQEVDALNVRLKTSEETVKSLQQQVEANEVVSRLPTLVFSGPAVERLAARQARSNRAAARRPASAATGADSADQRGRSAGGGGGTQPPESYAGAVGPAPPQNGGRDASPAPAEGERPGGSERTASSQAEWRSPEEDLGDSLISLLNSAFPGLGLQASNIDRVHGNGKKIWCRQAQAKGLFDSRS